MTQFLARSAPVDFIPAKQAVKPMKVPLEVVSPYNYVHLFGDCAGFDAKQMNLLLYLISMSVVEPHMLRYHPSLVAAAAVLLILEAADRSWNESLTFWSSYRKRDLAQCREAVRELWAKSFEEGELQRGSIIYLKYKDVKKYSVALEKPPRE